jgi:hypothetical protein
MWFFCVQAIGDSAAERVLDQVLRVNLRVWLLFMGESAAHLHTLSIA